jgi:dihydrofolate reductase
MFKPNESHNPISSKVCEIYHPINKLRTLQTTAQEKPFSLLYLRSMRCYLNQMPESHNSFSPPELPKISIIVAMTCDRVIGDQQGLPWHLPEDLQLFKRTTLGKTVIMGRKTYQSIGRPLSGRYNIVLSRSPEKLTGVQVCTSFIKSLTMAARHGQPVFVIGGVELYNKALPISTELRISWVKEDLPGDTLFPEFDLTEWTACSETEYSGFKHIHYQRINNIT